MKFFIVLTFCCQFIFAQDLHWVKDHEDSGFSIYTRQVKDSKILGIKAEGIIEAPLPAVMANLRNVEQSTDWTPGQLEKYSIDDISDLEAITFTLSDLPWPLSDRDMILHNKLFINKERQLLFVLSKSVEHEKNKAPKDGIVRAHVEYANIGLRPIDANKTYIELTTLVNPKGSIPVWVINFYQTKWPVEFLQALEKHSKIKSPPLRPGLREYLKKLLKILNMPKDMFDAKLSQKK